MTSFEDALRLNPIRYTENGAVALSATGDPVLDLFSVIGAIRDAPDARLRGLIDEAYKRDPALLAKTLFYARDIRGGLGERDTFRRAMHYCAEVYPGVVEPNIALIGKYGRWDDAEALIGTPLEDRMWAVLKEILQNDLRLTRAGGKPETLLAKWLPTADASSENTRKRGIYAAIHLGYTGQKAVYQYKRDIRELRKAIGIVESAMSANDWTSYDYSKLPSRAMFIHKAAFFRHDGERLSGYLKRVSEGKEKINAGTLYPYDLVSAYLGPCYRYDLRTIDPVIEAQWKAQPDWLNGRSFNALVMADTSASMAGRPFETAIGLAMYFAERNTAFKDMFLTFSATPAIQYLRGATLHDRIANLNTDGWMSNTDLEAALDLILRTALGNNVSSDEMVKALIVITDMEFDRCVDQTVNYTPFYESMRQKYEAKGYKMPDVVFWNVDSRHDTYHADANKPGVQLVSGQAASTFRVVMDGLGTTPVQLMLKVLNSDRYADVIVKEE